MHKNYIHLQCDGCGKVEEIPFSATRTVLRPNAVAKVTNWAVHANYPDTFFCSEECYDNFIETEEAKERDEAQSTFNHRREP